MAEYKYNKNVWNKYLQNRNILDDFADKYKTFLNNSKTERLAASEIEKALIKDGFKKISDVKLINVGDKLYAVNKNKNVIAFIIGKKMFNNLRILCSHIDSPRLDLKQNPIYEDGDVVLLDTHYYGGVKKYQWTAIPLALVGVVCKKNGEVVNINIGLDKKDPIFGVNDLLIHLSSTQMEKPLSKAIDGEKLDITFASIPLSNEKDSAIEKHVIKILEEKYGISKEDFTSAEIEAVPAFEARDFGIDRSMIASYGHDDRCCAFSSLEAFLNISAPLEDTLCAIFVDKEEIGSEGATSAQSYFVENTICRLIDLYLKKNKQQGDIFYNLRICLENSIMLSSDVTAADDPLFKEVSSKNNMARLGYGPCFNKYTGHKGKFGANDANPEYIAFLRNKLDKKDIYYQSNELGCVDIGGGGTIAYIFANYNMNVIDAGIPVFNMHAPMEVISKADLYETYLLYRTFLLD
ncbi:MAG: aminopeptidase [Bacilli bacterium]|nr:aminopeptidase [Bacilli bacterium]